MAFKLIFFNVLISLYVLVNGGIYVSESHSHESSSDSSESNEGNNIVWKIEEIETRLSELERQNSSKVLHCDCPNGWVIFHNSCYYFGTKDFEFFEAQIFCEDLEASLVNIGSELEYGFIKSQLKERKAQKHWIGLTDENEEGDWKLYPSAMPATIFEWGRDQPNQKEATNCAAIWESFEYKFVDEQCTGRNFRPLCEREKN